MRVRERTTELTRLNAELGRAKGDAEEANVSKTRFLAAASHEILQPLNAARLYVDVANGARRRWRERPPDRQCRCLTRRGSEEIFGALLDISRLDTGAMRAELVSFHIDEMLRQLEVEFSPLSREKGLDLKYVPCSLTVRSDRGCCGGCCRTSSPTRSNTHRKAACYSAAAFAAAICASTSTTPVSVSRVEEEDHLPRIPSPRRRRQGGARLGPRPLDRTAHWARARS
jgi:hypothetical protein